LNTRNIKNIPINHPWISIAVILLITAGAAAVNMMKPMEESFNNEDFLPDIDVAKANTIYTDTFTSSYPFIILFRSGHGDLVEPEDFRDMILLSEMIRDNETYQQWKDRSSQDDLPQSPAKAMYDMHRSFTFIEGMKEANSSLSTFIPATAFLNSTASDLEGSLEDIPSADDERMEDILSPLENALSSFMSMEPPSPGVGGDEEGPVEYFDSFNGTEAFKKELGTILRFNISDGSINDALGGLMTYTFVSASAVETLQDTREGIDSLLENGALNGSVVGRLEGLRENISRSLEVLGSLHTMASVQGNPHILGRMSQSFQIGQFILTNFLTEDFDPSSGELSAKGAMIIVNLDYSLNDMVDEDRSKVLEIEGNLSTLAGDFEGAGDTSVSAVPFERINERISEASSDSMKILFPLAMAFVFLILFIFYRSIIDIILNILALSMAILWMYGFGSLMGYSNNPMITAVPVLLVGLGIDYGIHLTMRYREEIRKGRSIREALSAMSASVGTALLLATFTTVFAFLSNLSSPVGLILQFGVMSAVGITASFLIMMTFLPAAKGLIDGWKARRKRPLFNGFREGECDLCDTEKKRLRFLDRTIMSLTVGAEKHPAAILTLVLVSTLILTSFAVKNEVTFDVNDFLPSGLPESDNIKYLLGEFRLGGSGDTGIIIVEGDLADPDVLRAMDRTMDLAMEKDTGYIQVEGSGSFARPKADFLLFSLKDTASMMGALSPENPFFLNYTRVFDMGTGLPREGMDRDDVGEVLSLFMNGFPSLARRVIHQEGSNFTMSAIAFTVVTESDDDAMNLLDELKEIASPLRELEGGGVDTVSYTGSSILMAVIVDAITTSQIRSVLITIIVSFLALTLAFFIEERSISLGAIATLPVVFCVIWIAGTMYMVGIPMNVMTITIGSLTVGLGITYGIHITHRFIEDSNREEDLIEASKKTVMNTGTALFGAALTTVGGFGLLSFASMPPLRQFGIVTALAITYSFLASIIVLPVLLILWAKARRKWRGMRKTS